MYHIPFTKGISGAHYRCISFLIHHHDQKKHLCSSVPNLRLQAAAPAFKSCYWYNENISLERECCRHLSKMNETWSWQFIFFIWCSKSEVANFLAQKNGKRWSQKIYIYISSLFGGNVCVKVGTLHVAARFEERIITDNGFGSRNSHSFIWRVTKLTYRNHWTTFVDMNKMVCVLCIFQVDHHLVGVKKAFNTYFPS